MLFYIMFLTGLILLFSTSFAAYAKRRTLKRSLKAIDDRNIFSEASAYLNSLISAAAGKDVPGGRVLAAGLISFAALFFVAGRVLTLPAALAASLLFVASPIIMLELKAEATRGKASREGLSMVSELYRQYRIHDRNIYEALEYTIDDSLSFPVCRRFLSKLLLRLRSAGNSRDISESLKQFSFALGTSWGNMLATCIRLSATKGTDVSEGLSDIVAQLKAAGRNAEKRRRMNSESVRMAVFLIPFMYVGSFFLSVGYLNLSPAKFFRNQFLTNEGIMFFLLLIIMFVFNLCAIRVVANKKIDY